MRPSVRRSLSWAAPLAVLAAALGVRLLGTPEIIGPVQAPFADFLTNLVGHPLHRPVFADRPEEVFLGLAGIAIILLLARARVVWAGVAFLVAAIAAGVFAWRMAQTSSLFFDAAFPVLALALVFLTGALVHTITTAGERARLRRSLDKHLAPAAMAAVTRNPDLLNLSGEARTMSYLVCGIRRYPQLAESFADEPEGLRRLTRRALSALSATVLDYHGAIDRITPGGLTAFFNAPLDDPEHAVHACECALAMTRALEVVNKALEQERRSDGSPFAPIEIGVGVNTGMGVVGDFGTDTRPEYTVAGRAARFAAEIEDASNKYGPAVIVADATRKLTERNFAFLEVDTVNTANAADPVKLFALLGNPLLRASPKFRALTTFHDHIFEAYRAGEWAKARTLIEQCRALSGASPLLYDLYQTRIAYYETHSPGENWNGAVRTPVT